MGGRVLKAIYALQKRAWRILRPRTRGVKVMLFDAAGALVLIRNSYGRSDLFVFAGGGIRPFERPEAAAAREVREELGLRVTNLVLRSRHANRAEGKRDTIFLFEAKVEGAPKLDPVEVAEARFVALDDLPAATSPATRRRIQEYLGRREPDGSW